MTTDARKTLLGFDIALTAERKDARKNAMKESAAAHLYQALRARVIAYEFPQGKRIYMEAIAEEFGVSTWPVKEALKRLAAEGLVIKAPHKGFVAMTLSEKKLMAQYDVTKLLLAQGLQNLDPAVRRNLPEYEPIAGILNKLNRRLLSDVKTLATYTGEIFAHIAALTDNPEVVVAINRANDRLFYIRTLECQHLDNVQTDLICFCELLLAGQCKELVTAIQTYHAQRIDLLPILLGALRH